MRQNDGVHQPPHYAIIGSRGYPSTYGGFETLVRKLAPYLAESGARVTVYSRDGNATGRTHHVGNVRVVRTPGLNSQSLSTLSFGATSCAHAAFSGYTAALVLNVANGYFLPVLRRAGVPTVVNVDGIEWERAKWNAVARAIFRGGAVLTARYASQIVVDSRAIGKYWADRFDVRSQFLPYGGDILPPRYGTLGALDLSDGAYILAVARLAPENNVDLLLDACERLNWQYPTVIVGSASAPNATEKRLRSLDATIPNLTWLGHVSDQELLGALWQRCGLYVHGHSVGGTNPALLQALGAGAPTVALATPYNREVLLDEKALYEPDSGALAELIRGLMETPQSRATLAELGPEIIANRYTWDSVLAGYQNALDSVSPSGRSV